MTPAPGPRQIGVTADGQPIYALPTTPPPPAPVCQHPPARTPAPVGTWVAAGTVGAALLLALAVSAVAIAISAVALTICVLVLRSVWQDIQKRR